MVSHGIGKCGMRNDDVPADGGDPTWPDEDSGCECSWVLPVDERRVDLC